MMFKNKLSFFILPVLIIFSSCNLAQAASEPSSNNERIAKLEEGKIRFENEIEHLYEKINERTTLIITAASFLSFLLVFLGLGTYKEIKKRIHEKIDEEINRIDDEINRIEDETKKVREETELFGQETKNIRSEIIKFKEDIVNFIKAISAQIVSSVLVEIISQKEVDKKDQKTFNERVEDLKMRLKDLESQFTQNKKEKDE